MNKFKISAVFAVLFITGVFIGTLISGFISSEKCLAIINPVISQYKSENFGVFKSSFLYSAKPVFFMWILCFSCISFYFNSLAVLYRGCILGVVSGAVIRCIGVLDGLLLIISAVLPHNIIYIPLIIYAASVTFIYNKYKNHIRLKNFLILGCILLLFLIVAALVDSMVTYDLINRRVKIVTT